eukprot:PhM_4_TR12410/c1_g1_i1/m.5212
MTLTTNNIRSGSDLLFTASQLLSDVALTHAMGFHYINGANNNNTMPITTASHADALQRRDVWSLGLTLYHMATGQYAFPYVSLFFSGRMSIEILYDRCAGLCFQWHRRPAAAAVVLDTHAAMTPFMVFQDLVTSMLDRGAANCNLDLNAPARALMALANKTSANNNNNTNEQHQHAFSLFNLIKNCNKNNNNDNDNKNDNDNDNKNEKKRLREENIKNENDGTEDVDSNATAILPPVLERRGGGCTTPTTSNNNNNNNN